MDGTSPPLRIMLVGGRSLCRHCLSLLIVDSLDDAVVTRVEDASQLTEMAAQARNSDVVLFTAICSQSGDLQLLEKVISAVGGKPIVVHTDAEDPRLLASLAEQGIRGVIPASLTADVALAALQLVAAGGIYFPSQFSKGRTALDKGNGPCAFDGSDRAHLTPREAQVLGLIAKGLRNKQVAAELGVAEATVKIHIQNLFRKLHVNNRTEAAAFAARLLRGEPEGIPGPPPPGEQ